MSAYRLELSPELVELLGQMAITARSEISSREEILRRWLALGLSYDVQRPLDQGALMISKFMRVSLNEIITDRLFDSHVVAPFIAASSWPNMTGAKVLFRWLCFGFSHDGDMSLHEVEKLLGTRCKVTAK